MDPWTSHMLRGDFDAAWCVSDATMRARAGTDCSHLERHEQYVWRGDPWQGKRVLVRCYHGLGDTIQFVRYAPMLRAAATEVVVWAQPALVPLLRTMRDAPRLEPLHDGVPDFTWDVDVESMELPHVFRTTMGTIPDGVPYLHVEPAPLAREAPLEVAVAWRAGDWNPRRTIPADALVPLKTLAGVRFHLLHPGPGATALGTARLMRAVDLVISVDTMTAHLAGALGVPVWTLLPAEADWRWLEGREDSPWYPTMRLFRQERDGDWPAVVERVAAALEERTRAP